ncbi:CLUMA_CG014550, isoform A [Clunio marinus]|uniref:CLUMA_CG014550, isoform A n=1 Tax=Clunio marinus TaxID=568069 RepID=A0A1J1IQ04_9DIPT|nr:CLUMA_CG014550, isoform A [Clunio marinus]
MFGLQTKQLPLVIACVKQQNVHHIMCGVLGELENNINLMKILMMRVRINFVLPLVALIKLKLDINLFTMHHNMISDVGRVVKLFFKLLLINVKTFFLLSSQNGIKKVILKLTLRFASEISSIKDCLNEIKNKGQQFNQEC